MKIGFKNHKLKKRCRDVKQARIAWGALGDRVLQRLAELGAFDNLGMVPTVPPQRLHLLGADMAGKFAVDLSGKDRLIFSPAGKFEDLKSGGIDKATVTEVIIEEVKNYHR